MIITSSKTSPHDPPETVQRNTLLPTDSPLTSDEALLASAKMPEPERVLQIPPVAAVALSVADDEHVVWSIPALGVIGAASTAIVT